MFKDTITRLRKEKNISQEQLAMALNASRQAVSKWERGETYPDIDKLSDIASFFDVSIDYLLDYDLQSKSVNSFIKRIDESTNNNKFDITIDEINNIICKNNNNFILLIKIICYLFAGLDEYEDNKQVVELLLEYSEKAKSIFVYNNSLDVSINDLNVLIVSCYVLQEKYQEAKEYIIRNDVQKVDIVKAECDYWLGNYEEAKNSASNLFLNSIVDIIDSNFIQLMLLLKDNKINEGYDLLEWSLSFVKSIGKEEYVLLNMIFIIIFFRAICGKNLNKDTGSDMDFLKKNVKDINRENKTDEIKFYYDKNIGTIKSLFDTKKLIKKEIEGLKESMIYEDALSIYHMIFNG